MEIKRALLLALPLMAFFVFLGAQRGISQSPDERIARIAELEIYPDQVGAYKAALKEEISASISKEPGVLTLYAVSLKGHPEQIRLFDVSAGAKIPRVPVEKVTTRNRG